MTIKKTTTVLMAAVIAVATVLAAGLAVLPSSVQDAQANPCASEVGSDNINNGFNPQANADDERECDFTGYFEFDEGETSDNGLAATETDDVAATETDGAEATTGNNIVDNPLFNLADVFDESD
jgi:hypothetical protein